MNSIIETLFNNFTVDGVVIPVDYMNYEGHGEPYIVYREYDKDSSYAADDNIEGYVVYYDFDVYSKGDIINICQAVIKTLTGAGWTWQPRRDSPDLYETDTEYYHKTLCFAYPLQINEEE